VYSGVGKKKIRSYTRLTHLVWGRKEEKKLRRAKGKQKSDRTDSKDIRADLEDRFF